MGFYPHVKKGDKVRPSASLENAKRDLVNRFQGIAKAGNKARITSVAVYNATDTKITAYSAVTLARDKVIQDIIPIAATSVKGDQIFGIVLDAIESGKVGYAAIDGITNAQVTIRSNLHKYAVAGPGGKLESADSGPVMLCGRYDATSKQIVCLVKLSAGSHETAGYTGDFQIIAKADGGFVIADGNSWNGSRSAGSKCIINGREITVDDYSISSGTAYLMIDFSAVPEGGDPTATLAQTKNSGEYFVNIPIAAVVDGIPKQIYQGGIFIYERTILKIHGKLSTFFVIKNGTLQAATGATAGVLEYDQYNGLRTTPTTTLPDEVRENGIG